MEMNMEERQLDKFRFERKYILPKMYFSNFFTQLHELNFFEIYNQRTINNLYFDSCDFELLRDNIEGLSDRKKVRVRWYGSLFGKSQKKLEIKIKKEFLNIKKTLNLHQLELSSYDNICRFHEKINENINPLNNIFFYNLILNRKPVLLNSYKRLYYSNSSNDIRITIDSDLFFYSPITKIRSEEQNIIIEIKYNNDINFKNEFRNLYLSRYSKYAKGLNNSFLYKPNY